MDTCTTFLLIYNTFDASDIVVIQKYTMKNNISIDIKNSWSY